MQQNIRPGGINTINEKNAWKSITDTRSALLGNYGLMRSALADNEANWMYGELRGSAFKSVSGPISKL
ncbi:hypothetical protein KRR40_36485 [Niabella defluvii]|nr:hypothetical protein KRR40_36485 [Niabella sp. I65]